MIDTHCHLYLDQFDKDRSSVIEQAMKAGVSKMLTPAIDYETSLISCELSKENPGVVYAAVGIHPNYSHEYIGNSFADIFTKFADQIMAIGEIGLDYFRDYSPKKEQISVFEHMLSLAKNKQLPICLHVRKSESDMLEILSNWYCENPADNSQTGVFHAFEGSPEVADWAIARGFYLGVGGMITYKRNAALREIIKEIGLDHIILETDAPYLSPVPNRGKRNTPEYIPIITREIASLFGKTVEEVSQVTDDNANRLFGFK